MKLTRNFYKKDSLSLAKDLLGKVLVRKFGDKELRARIVETEAYPGEEDKASHNYGGRITERTKTLYMGGGHLYVYLIYGIYALLNIVAGDVNSGQGVLIRAVEPLDNIDDFAQNRFGKNYEDLSSYQRKNLSNGPGKLTKALDISTKAKGLDLVGDIIYLEDDGYKDFTIVTKKRIGIDYAEEAKDFPYRFYIGESKYVSVR
jgi:DNA-3-methyladenine glycosylase